MIIGIIGLFLVLATLLYHRASLAVFILATLTYSLLWFALSPDLTINQLSACLIGLFIVYGFLYFSLPRYILFTKPILAFYLKVKPTMSKTEQEALMAGTVGWEGELFNGSPNWDRFMSYQNPKLSAEEQAFIEGPVEALCNMIDDWDITHKRLDIPREIWDFLKQNGFFSLIIPKQYGGKAFSAYAHSQILIKVYSCSATVATTIAVPNSLGPAELLLHYGTDEQKNYYLPRLARGEEIPCFALTGPEAGSDAGAMIDTGIVCWGQFNEQKTLGINLNWNKRYITLAPVATVIGLAFKLFDPDHLLGETKELGITCALIPRDTQGVTIGRRHFPVNIPFQNGPTQGKNVFIPLDWIIGGQKMVGKGWQMLMECLAAGRAISLPASSLGGAKLLVYASGAYSKIRKQFNVSIASFEGIEQLLARMTGYTYLMDATRAFTAGIIDSGEKPSIASAITKYHVTELGRTVGNDAMDIHGGKGICLGPKNYLGRIYQSIPIAITVEGANVLTRNMIIFGQGAMRCHPFIRRELEAANLPDKALRLKHFDAALMGHLQYTLSNIVRSFFLGISGALFVVTPKSSLKRHMQLITRYSASFALIADLSLLTLGGALKRKENLSARLGDVLSYLYLYSASLKHFLHQGDHKEDLAILEWSATFCIYKIQQALDDILINFPSRALALMMRIFIFPLGKNRRKPSDFQNHNVCKKIITPTDTRSRLTQGAYLTNNGRSHASILEEALIRSIEVEPIEMMLKEAIRDKRITKHLNLLEMIDEARSKGVISFEQADSLLNAKKARDKVIAVDDFSNEELLSHLSNRLINESITKN